MADRIEQITIFISKNPTDPFLHHALALEWVKKGEDIKAKDIWVTLLTSQPTYLAAYYHVAKLHEKMGLKNQAITYYQKGMAVAKEQKDSHAFNELQVALEECE